jgi:hypothetical protein
MPDHSDTGIPKSSDAQHRFASPDGFSLGFAALSERESETDQRDR